MSDKAKPLFLARRTYRQRRVMDAARLLPIFGGLMFCVPILWAPATAPEAETGRGTLYLFGVWAALIIAAFVLSRKLPREEPEKPRTEQPGEDA